MKNKSKVIRYFRNAVSILGLSGLLFSNCANPRSPTGGAKDTIPPSLLESIPPLLATNYSGNKIRLVFDEYIQTQNLKKELLISPKLKTKYEIKEGGKYVEIRFDSTLDQNTTYTFNFQESIKDVTEKTPWEKNKFAFSTGSEIDSLHINGKVLNLLTNLPMKQAVVGLYNASDTISPFNGQPLYFAKTDKEGKWEILYIKEGDYLLYTFTDKNQNLTIDPRNDFSGFLADTLHLKKNLDSLKLGIVKRDTRELKIQKALPSGKYFKIGFSKAINDFSVKGDSLNTPPYNLEKDRKTICFYNTKQYSLSDSIPIRISAIDSLEQKIDSLLYVKFRESKRKLNDFEISVEKQTKRFIDSNFVAGFWFSKPVSEINSDSIYFEIDSLNTLPVDPKECFTWNDSRNRLKITKLLKVDSASIVLADSTKFPDLLNFSLKMNPGSFISVEKDSSTQISQNYHFATPEKIGSISGKINTRYKSYFVQLINSRYEIVDELESPKKYRFTDVDPTKYRIRVLVDANNNGLWDMGNINKRIAPEPVYFFPKEIELRANWELTNIDLKF
ncbi:MAG: Ig-like domain-containing protein [Cytophagales bacterium]|nr:Ig-like domain-containing protein [Cytophagales bacterium]